MSSLARLWKVLLRLIVGLVVLLLAVVLFSFFFTESRRLPQDQEAALIEDTIVILTDILHHEYDQDKILPDQPWRATKFLRDTHPKANACVRANFTVLPELSPNLRLGLFAGKPDGSRTYKAWVRFSNAANHVTDDHAADFRGMVMKLVGVSGARLPVPGDEQHTQDFFFVAHNTFFAGNVKHFHDFFAAIRAGGYDPNPLTNWRLAWNLFLRHPRGAYNGLQVMLHNVFPSIADISWFSVAPFALAEPLGPQNAVKYGAFPCPGRKIRWTEPGDGPNYLTERLAEDLAPGGPGMCLDFKVQIRAHESQPLENTLVAWDEGESPWRPVARIEFPAQEFQSPEQFAFCQNLTFNPWHGLLAHMPLGGLNRARRDVMTAMQDVRLRENGNQRFEPTGDEVFYPGAKRPWLAAKP
jgi:hypothetical protein